MMKTVRYDRIRFERGSLQIPGLNAVHDTIADVDGVPTAWGIDLVFGDKVISVPAHMIRQADRTETPPAPQSKTRTPRVS